MYILICYFKIYIEESLSLKDKRKVVRSIIDNLRIKFKISISEIGYLNNKKYAGIGLSAISSNREYLEKLNTNIETFIHTNYPGRLNKKNYIIENISDFTEF